MATKKPVPKMPMKPMPKKMEAGPMDMKMMMMEKAKKGKKAK